MSIQLIEHGDIFASKANILVNPVNCVGVAGKGLAKEFKRRYPWMHKAYAADCAAGFILLGRVKLYPRILCFPTKRHWRDQSELAWIEAGLDHLIRYFRNAEPMTMAIPALGCGLGGLPWDTVRPLIESKMADYPGDVELYAPRP